MSELKNFPDDWFDKVPIEFQKELEWESFGPIFDKDGKVRGFSLCAGIEIKGELIRQAIFIGFDTKAGEAYKKLVVWCYEKKFGAKVWER